MKDSVKLERLIKSYKRLLKAVKKKEKAVEFRIWVEENPHIHLLNYPYYRLKKAFNTTCANRREGK